MKRCPKGPKLILGVCRWDVVLYDKELGSEGNKGTWDTLVKTSGQWVNWSYGYSNTYAQNVWAKVGTRGFG